MQRRYREGCTYYYFSWSIFTIFSNTKWLFAYFSFSRVFLSNSVSLSAWCYVGKRRLEKALSEVDQSRVNVSIRWHPFELDKNLPTDGSLMKMDRYRAKFGEQRVAQMFPAMVETGKKEGIRFSFGGRLGSTIDSHRLLSFVREQPDGEKKQNQLIDLLFQASFENEEDLSNHQLLVRLAEQLGFQAEEIRTFLQSDRLRREVQEEIRRASQQGIDGVPHFRLNEQIELSGAQDPQAFLQAFHKLHIPTVKS